MTMDWGPPISSYSRAQAIADGVLVPVTDLVPDEPNFAADAGFKVPVVLTSAVAELVKPTEEEAREWAQDVKGRLWDVLMMATWAVRASKRPSGNGELLYDILFRLVGRTGQFAPKDGKFELREMKLKLLVHPGDEGEPVATIMLPEED